MMAHDAGCGCPACHMPGRTSIEQRDRDLFADEWLRHRPTEHAEARSIRTPGHEGAPGSPRRVALQAIADARAAGMAARVVRIKAEELLR